MDTKEKTADNVFVAKLIVGDQVFVKRIVTIH